MNSNFEDDGESLIHPGSTTKNVNASSDIYTKPDRNAWAETDHLMHLNSQMSESPLENRLKNTK